MSLPHAVVSHLRAVSTTHNRPENRVEDGGALHFCKALPFCPSLELLNLSKNKVSREELENVLLSGRQFKPSFYLQGLDD
jgi:hypothetical protein